MDISPGSWSQSGRIYRPLQGVFDWATGLRLIKRAELMDSAAGGMMAALIESFNREQLEQQIQQA